MAKFTYSAVRNTDNGKFEVLKIEEDEKGLSKSTVESSFDSSSAANDHIKGLVAKARAAAKAPAK